MKLINVTTRIETTINSRTGFNNFLQYEDIDDVSDIVGLIHRIKTSRVVYWDLCPYLSDTASIDSLTWSDCEATLNQMLDAASNDI